MTLSFGLIKAFDSETLFTKQANNFQVRNSNWIQGELVASSNSQENQNFDHFIDVKMIYKPIYKSVRKLSRE